MGVSGPGPGGTPMNTDQIPRLPDNLPNNLAEKLNLFKEKRIASSGKQKFFNRDVNYLLLEIEKMSRKLPVGVRHQIYIHMASLCKCTKETMMKRGKKLLVNDEENEIKKNLAQLKSEVELLMPVLMKKYQESHNSSSDSNVTKPGKMVFKWNEQSRRLLVSTIHLRQSFLEHTTGLRCHHESDQILQFFKIRNVANLAGWMDEFVCIG